MLFLPRIATAWWSPLIPAGMLIVTLLWPSGGLHGYFSYRMPVVVAAFLAELWILAGGVALQAPAGPHVSDGWFQAFLVVFFLLTMINSLPGLTGGYRAGVELRPDVIFGRGAYLVRGEIFVALGIEIGTARGVRTSGLELVGGRRRDRRDADPDRAARHPESADAARGLMGLDTWTGSGLRDGVWVREIFLYLALLLAVYAFANMFLGRVPFTWPPAARDAATWAAGSTWLAAATLVLIPVRGWVKVHLPEPGPLGPELGKQALLWLGLVLMVLGFLTIFAGATPSPSHLAANLWWGGWVSLLGFLMIVPLRALTSLGTEHYEIATYESLIASATAMGQQEVRDLLEQNCGQEKHTSQELLTAAQKFAAQTATRVG